MTGVMPVFNELLGDGQDVFFFFHHLVGRQSTIGLANAHAAPSCGESKPHGLGRLDAVFQSRTVWVDVEMVAAGGAAREQQFGHGDLV